MVLFENFNNRRFYEILKTPEPCGSLKIQITEGSLKYFRNQYPAVLLKFK
jgi:hypothetical protein